MIVDQPHFKSVFLHRSNRSTVIGTYEPFLNIKCLPYFERSFSFRVSPPVFEVTFILTCGSTTFQNYVLFLQM